MIRYGEDEGYERYKANNKKKLHSLETFIDRHGESIGSKKWKQYLKKTTSGFSAISVELFDRLSDYSVLYVDKEIIIEMTESEYNLLKLLYIRPDFIDNKKIIEFNGDYWHDNLDVFPNDYFINNVKMLASDIRIRDKKRIEVLKKRGYEVKVVWENDFRKDKEKVIQDCKEFLDGE